MSRQVVAIARNTFTESIRQPIYIVLLLLGMALLAVNLAFSSFTLEDDNMLLLDLGLSTLLLLGLFLGAFTAAGVVSREIENQTVLTVLSKPVSRITFLAGKYLGVLAALACAEWIWMIVFVLTIRHRVMSRATDVADMPVLVFGLGAVLASLGTATALNFFGRRVFASVLTRTLVVTLPIALVAAFSFDKAWHVQSPLVELHPQVLIALLLLFEAVALLGAIAIAVSTRLGQVASLILCTLVFLLGVTSDHFFAGHLDDSVLARIAYAVIPNVQFLWLSDALLQGNPASLTYVLNATAYTAALITAVLALAVGLFETRELR